MKLSKYFVAFLLVGLAANAQALIYKVGTGTGCTHASLQSAVNAAAANAGFDTIRVTRSIAYNNIVVTMSNQGLMIQGRWANCSSAAQDITRTLLNGNNSSSVLSISGGETVILDGLEITNGNTSAYATDAERRGGGIKIRQTSTGSVILQNLRLQQNSAANHGGALSVDSNATSFDDGSLLQIGADVEIRNNFASFDAGGLSCRNSRVEATSPRIDFVSNFASRHGGAIAAENCLLTLASEGGAFNAMFVGNSASGNGGALHMRSSIATAYSNRNDAPIRFFNNSATLGGAVYLADANLFVGYETSFENNLALSGGGAFYQFSGVPNAPNELRLLRRGAGGPGERCVVESCGRLIGNRARLANGNNTLGAVLEIVSDASGSTVVSVFAGQRLSGNEGMSLLTCNRFRTYRGTCTSTLENSVIAENAVFSSYYCRAGARLDVINSTLANNTAGTYIFDITADTEFFNPGLIKIRNSIFAENPTARPFPASAQLPLVGFDISYLLSANTSGISGESVVQGGVVFADAAAGDYRPLSSNVLDSAPNVPGTYSEGLDFVGLPRDADIPGLGNDGANTQDWGAYERSSDPIFANGFDP